MVEVALPGIMDQLVDADDSGNKTTTRSNSIHSIGLYRQHVS